MPEATVSCIMQQNPYIYQTFAVKNTCKINVSMCMGVLEGNTELFNKLDKAISEIPEDGTATYSEILQTLGGGRMLKKFSCSFGERWHSIR